MAVVIQTCLKTRWLGQWILMRLVLSITIICLDTDDEDYYEREQAVLDRLKDNGVEPKAELVVITQKVCIESWFLGNRELVKKSLRGADIEKYINFYNVGEKDPELMSKPIYSTDSIAMFHYKYLRTLMKKNGELYQRKTI